MANISVTGYDKTTGKFRPIDNLDFATKSDGAAIIDPTSTRKLATVSGISLTATGTTTLYTVPANKTAIIQGVMITCTAATAITVAATAGVGIAAGEDDIIASTTLTGLTSTDKTWQRFILDVSRTAPSASVVKLGVDTAATGTSQTVTVDVFGYFTDDPVGLAGFNPVSCRLAKTGSQSIPNNSGTAVTFNVETFDNGNLHSTVTNTSRITATVSGTYLFSGCISFDSNVTGARQAYILKNGVDLLDVILGEGTTLPAYQGTTTVVSMVAGDYVELIAYQNSGGALNINGTSGEYTFFEGALIENVAGALAIPGPFSTRVEKSAVQSISNVTITALTFDVETYDHGGMHSTSTNTSRLTVLVAGVYTFEGSINYVFNATGTRAAFIVLNGTTFLAVQDNMALTNGDPAYNSVTAIMNMAVGDYVELVTYQSSGGALNVQVLYTHFSAVFQPGQ